MVYPSVPTDEPMVSLNKKYKIIRKVENNCTLEKSLRIILTFTKKAIQEAAAALPSVPQEEPGGEDSYATLKPQRSSKKKPMLESVD